MIESKLGELTEESLRLKHGTQSAKLLELKKAWLKVDAYTERVKSLGDAVVLLVEKLKQAAHHQMHPLLSANVGKCTPLGKVWYVH